MEGSTRELLLNALEKAGVEILTGSRIKAVNLEEGQVEGCDTLGSLRKVSADDFVVALAMRSNQKMPELSEGHFPNDYSIGDCQAPGSDGKSEVHSTF